MFNEAEQILSRATLREANTSPVLQIMRVSDASGIYEEVILRPKTEPQNRRLARRPLAALSGFFKLNRNSNADGNAGNSPKCTSPPTSDKDVEVKKPKKKSWNIFKSKKKQRCNESPSFQHFQEPLNIERFSLSLGGAPIINSDAEWYDLNKEEMSLFEAHVSDILNEFNSNCCQTFGKSESESMYRCELGRYLNISSNILWSHNLSMSCQSTNNASNINLLGANINKDQIHSEIFIEDGDTDRVCYTATQGYNSSFVSTDSDGYVIMMKPFDVHHSYNSHDSSNLSSGFGSDFDAIPPQTSPSMVVANSPATSDFSEAFTSNTCSPSRPLTAKTMQKTSKKQCLQTKSRKLLGMLNVKPTPSPLSSPTQSDVTSTPQNKSPHECMEKMRQGTPFKVRLSKQPGHAMKPLHSFQL